MRVRQRDRFEDFRGQVILACDGFEASASLRRQYLGESWDVVVARGTRFNTGTMLERVIAAGPGNAGNWTGVTRVGNLSVSECMSRYSYPFSVMVHLGGKRFIDEEKKVFG